MKTSVEKRYIRFYLHYSKGKKTISHIKYILRKKRAARTKLKANIINEKIARFLHNDSVMGSKNDTYCTEQELIRGYVAPSYKELSVDEQIMYDKKEPEKREEQIITLRIKFTRETGAWFLDDVSIYADWLEKQLIEEK